MDSKQIEEQAAAWLEKRDSGRWSAEDERELERWLGASSANEVAFIRLEAAWNGVQRLKVLAAGRERGVVPELFREDAGRRPVSAAAPSWLPRALAATLILTIAATLAWYTWPRGPAYHTPIGGIASVPMTDGSKVTLNTDSAVRVAVSEKERRVQLEQGEAFFEVAKDPDRPFVVMAGNKRVIAVGTQFSVRRIDDDIRVLVTEGKVRIESGNGPVLTAGSVARTDGGGVLVQEKPLSEVEDYLSWRTGYLVFREVPLADAVAEFNRYNTQKIVIENPAVAAIRLSGKFKSTNFEAFVRLLEEGFPIDARRVDDQIILTDRR